MPARAAMLLAFSLGCATAHAQLFRAYLAPGGSDSNPCTLSSPCRLLPAALTAVQGGGEIWMLDSANYNVGPVDIAKSVTILAVPGALGSVVAAGGPAIVIATGGVRVALRNLVIVPLPGAGGTDGIHMTLGAGLNVEDCLVARLPGSGISVSGASSVRITNTTIRDNAVAGVLLQDGARATLTRATVSGNNNGVLVSATAAGTLTTADIADSTVDANSSNGVTALSSNGTAVVKVSVRSSRAVRNAANGLVAFSDFGAAVTLSASDNIISNNGTGIGAFSAGSKAWAAGNVVSDNGTGFWNGTGSVFESAGNNAVRNNGSDTFGPIGVVSKS
jgi:parallel beta-helix repeat protein